MPKLSAGILLYRTNKDDALEVLLVHPGGPFWKNKDAGAWSIPKGEYQEGEDPFAAALKEFTEETGVTLKPQNAIELGQIQQKGGKRVTAWAIEGDLDPNAIQSNTFTLEWPPRSGKQEKFPEADRAAWFSPADAREKINQAQRELIDRLEEILS